MPNHHCKILTVAEEMLKKITERYIWYDKSWLEKYEPDNTSHGNDRKSMKQGNSQKQGMEALTRP
jgi:hypothetical protein